MLTPDKVFTPGKPPVEQTNVYVARGEAQVDLSKALERSFVPLIFGEYGVGKTSLARHVVLDSDRTGKLINVESVDGRDFGDVLEQVLERAGFMIQRSVTRAQSNTDAATVESQLGSSFMGFTAKLKGQQTQSNQQSEVVEQDLVVTSPSDSKVLDICESQRFVLLLDELHKASRNFVKSLSAFIKAVHNKPCRHFKLILVGTGSDATRLVELDPGIDRVLQEIRLPGMTDTEARTLVETGMAKLTIEMHRLVIDRLVRIAVGSPSLIQFLALEVAEQAFKRDPREVADEDLDRALKQYVDKRASRLNAAYLKAIETIGPKRYRKCVLHAMSVLPDEYVTMDQIAKQVTRDLGDETPSTALSGPLRALKSDEYGKILKDVARQEEGDRVFNYSAFTDPSMKAFVRMRYVAEKDDVHLGDKP